MGMRMKASTMVRPAAAMPTTTLWLSPIDLLMPSTTHHIRTVYMYRPNGADNFFDPTVLKETLGRALVHFYPMAGRLKWGKDRIEVECNGEGALFVEAEYDGVMDDLGDFHPSPALSCFVPIADSSKGISTSPLLLIQVTRFKCGAVCLGIANEYHMSDGVSANHFILTWSDIARGLDVTMPPFLDRQAVMSARNPPQPKFPHEEYQPPPTIITPQDDGAALEPKISRTFSLNRDQINALKAKCGEGDVGGFMCSSFVAVVAHIWRGVCISRGLPIDQELRVYIPVDGRMRLRPPLPRGYFGNVIFYATAIASAGELESDPVKFPAKKLHDAIARMDDAYLRSALDFVESRLGARPTSPIRHALTYPNLVVNSWAKLRSYDTDFGWGQPIHFGYAEATNENKITIISSATNDGSLSFRISLTKKQMECFEKLHYDDGISLS